MRISRRSLVVGLSALLSAAGCASGPVAGVYPAPALRPVAGDDFDEYKFDEEEPTPVPGGRSRRGRRRPASRRRSGEAAVRGEPFGFGARVGLLIPASADIDTPDPRLLLGGFYQLRLAPNVGLELALDLGPTNEGTEGIVYVGRAGVIWLPSAQTPAYVIGGVGAGIERFKMDDEESGFLEIGGGYNVSLGGRTLDLRGAYWLQLGSENVQGIVALTAGYRF